MEAKWGRMHRNEHRNEDYKTLRRGGEVIGWVVKIDGQWIARKADGTIRAEFDTMKAAQQFLTLMVSAGERNE